MILLLDAHVLLWAVADPGQLHETVRGALESPQNEVVVSAGSIWELEIKRAAGKLRIDVDLLAELEQIGFDVVPITAVDATKAARLPLLHRDPFDRMLVAQAQRLDAVLVSRDPAVAAYEIEVLRA